MPSYNKQTLISTYTVDKILIEHLENYLKQNVFEILNLESNSDDNLNKVGFSVSLHDSLGVEKYSSIKEYKLPLFRNDIKGITLELEISINNKELKVSLRFGDKQENSDLAVSLIDDNPREKVSAIEQGILSILNNNKNINKVFYPGQIITPILFLGCLFSGILAFNSAFSVKEKFISGVVFCVLTFYSILIPNFLKPFSAFETNKQKQLDKLFIGLGSVLLGLLGTLFTSVRKNLLGF